MFVSDLRLTWSRRNSPIFSVNHGTDLVSQNRVGRPILIKRRNHKPNEEVGSSSPLHRQNHTSCQVALNVAPTAACIHAALSMSECVLGLEDLAARSPDDDAGGHVFPVVTRAYRPVGDRTWLIP